MKSDAVIALLSVSLLLLAGCFDQGKFTGFRLDNYSDQGHSIQFRVSDNSTVLLNKTYALAAHDGIDIPLILEYGTYSINVTSGNLSRQEREEISSSVAGITIEISNFSISFVQVIREL